MYPAVFLLPLAAAAVAFLLLGRLARCLGRPGGLPPGTLGLPLLGETLRLISAYKTEFPDPFVDDRLRRLRGGHRVFTTHLFGEPTVFSADPEVNRQVLQGEGRVFVSSYPSSITTLLGRRSLLVMRGAFHRRMHGLLGSTIASPVVIRDHLLPDIDRIIRRTLDAWEDADYPAGKRVLLQDQAKKITFDLTVKQLMSVDPGDWTEGLRKEYLLLIEGFFSLPLPFSFTTYGRALKARTQVAEGLRSVVRERKQEALLNRAEDVAAGGGGDQPPPEKGGGGGGVGNKRKRSKDLLGALLEAEREDGEEFTEEEAVDFLLALLVAGYETTSTIMTLAVKYLADHPRALAFLREEHEAIRDRKEGAVLDWADYKSMPFTQCVINETLRVANIISGVFRRAVADVPIKGGYTIPKGCKVFASFRAVHMDPAYYADARSFDPWRWWSPQQKTTAKGTLDHLNGGAGDNNDDDGDDKKSKKSVSNNKQQQAQQLQVGVGGGNLLFCPFGGGPRLCPGYELGRVEISVFLHYLVTRFSWEAAEDDKVVFFPTTRTVKGYPINVRPRRRPSRTCA